MIPMTQLEGWHHLQIAIGLLCYKLWKEIMKRSFIFFIKTTQWSKTFSTLRIMYSSPCYPEKKTHTFLSRINKIIKNNSSLCSNGTRSPEATNIWPRATCWCWFLDLQSKSKKKMLFNGACVGMQRSFHVNSRVTQSSTSMTSCTVFDFNSFSK